MMSRLPSIGHRLVSGFSLAGALFAAFFFLPDAFMPAVLAGLGGLLAWEFFGLVASSGLDNYRCLGTAGCVAMILVTWFAQPGWVSAMLLILTMLPVCPASADTTFTGEVTYRDGRNVYLQNGSTGKMAHLDSSNDAGLMEQVKQGKVVNAVLA